MTGRYLAVVILDSLKRRGASVLYRLGRLRRGGVHRFERFLGAFGSGFHRVAKLVLEVIGSRGGRILVHANVLSFPEVMVANALP